MRHHGDALNEALTAQIKEVQQLLLQGEKKQQRINDMSKKFDEMEQQLKELSTSDAATEEMREEPP